MVTKEELRQLQIKIAKQQERARELQKQIEHEKMLDQWEENLHLSIAANQYARMQERRKSELEANKINRDRNESRYSIPPEIGIRNRNRIRFGDIVGSIAGIAMLGIFVASILS